MKRAALSVGLVVFGLIVLPAGALWYVYRSVTWHHKGPRFRGHSEQALEGNELAAWAEAHPRVEDFAA